MIWYSTTNPRRRPKLGSAFLVAVEVDDHRMTLPGFLKRGVMVGYGCNVAPYAWCYSPLPPAPAQVKP